MKAPPADPALELLRERCRRAGLPVTPQRLAIYRALAGSHDHPSPEQLFARVKGAMPSISLATIYKTLDTLLALGLASELPSGADARRYDGNMAPHQHLVCDACHAVEDVCEAALELPLPKPKAGFIPRTVRVSVHGLCRRCSSRGAA